MKRLAIVGLLFLSGCGLSTQLAPGECRRLRMMKDFHLNPSPDDEVMDICNANKIPPEPQDSVTDWGKWQ